MYKTDAEEPTLETGNGHTPGSCRTRPTTASRALHLPERCTSGADLFHARKVLAGLKVASLQHWDARSCARPANAALQRRNRNLAPLARPSLRMRVSGKSSSSEELDPHSPPKLRRGCPQRPPMRVASPFLPRGTVVAAPPNAATVPLFLFAACSIRRVPMVRTCFGRSWYRTGSAVPGKVIPQARAKWGASAMRRGSSA
jgi:hypothetical protein